MAALVPEGWLVEPSARDGGTRYHDGKGNQVRIMPGVSGSRDPLHSGPYAVISWRGRVHRIPLADNPALRIDG